MLTVEPYGPGNLLGDIAAGGYDSLITDIAQQVAALKTTVIVRFAPEMDHVSRVPWSLKEPSAYIAAYRHFVTKFRSIAPNSRQCWSPVGDKGLEVYYPGDDVVDYTGFSIYEIPECSTTWVGHPQSFADWMNDKYPLLARFGKPIILAEVGVVSTTDQKHGSGLPSLPSEAIPWSRSSYITMRLILCLGHDGVVQRSQAGSLIQLCLKTKS